MPATQFPAVIELSGLNGLNGFKLEGEGSIDVLGISVNSAGDLNGDGIADLVIGAYAADIANYTDVGKAYVIFGSKQITSGNNGTLNLNSLMDGQRGFVLHGQATGDFFGLPVGAAGDFNCDGIDDLYVGALSANPGGRTDAGKTYVIFGSVQVNSWGNGTLNVSTLINGVRGFVLQGEQIGDASGYSVGLLDDINGDGLSDLLIGANPADPAGRTDAGKTYVVFGSCQPGAWNSGTIELSNLMNGQRGFVLQGEAASDFSGISVSQAGDINGDEMGDLLIGASHSHPGNKTHLGKSYLVFGSNISNAWGTGILDLSALMNGQRGFALLGQAIDDYSGCSVSQAGDINGDEVDDFVVGAYLADVPGRNDTGKSYVLFGNRNTGVWGNGTLELSRLMNAQNGFVLQGETADDWLGYPVSSADDINHDGLSDLLLGATSASFDGRIGAGKSYIIFGSSQNASWGNGTIDVGTLIDGQRGFVLQGETTGDQSGSSINAIGDLNGDNIIDLAIGAYQASPGGRIHAGKAYVLFGDVAPEIFVNRLDIQEGGSLILGQQFINATDRNHPISSLRLIANNISHGQFEFVSAGGQAITQFTQGQISTGQVRFVHDGGELGPSYYLQVLSDGLALSPPSDAAMINFTNVNDSPFFINNQLTLLQGQTVNLTSMELSAGDPDSSVGSLAFYVNGLQHGVFYSVPQTRTVNNFLQSNITDGDIQFVHDGTQFPPFYQVVVSDGLAYSASQGSVVIFNGVNLAPAFVNNNLNIAEDQSVTLSTNYLNAFDADTPVDRITFIVNNVQHGQFERFAFAGLGITSFTLQEVQQNSIRFVHDGSEIAPSYTLSVTDGNSIVGPRAAVINYLRINNPPTLQNNQLSLLEGETITLDLTDLSATDRDSPIESLTFTVSSVERGRFELTSNPGTVISSFSQEAVNSSLVRFVHDGGELAPSYSVTVDDGLLSTLPKAAQINFTNVDDAPIIRSNQLTIKEGEAVALTTSQLEVIDVDTPADEVIITPGSVQHGSFERVFDSGVEISAFSKQDLEFGFIRFSHDGGEIAPSYVVAASDGLLSTPSSSALISFTQVNDPPVLEKNQLMITEGETISVNSTALSTTDPDSNIENLIFTVTNVQHGEFITATQNQPIASFYQKNVTGGDILFVHDGSNEAPSFLTTVSDGQFTTVPQPAAVHFTAIDDAPVVIDNSLTIGQGESVIFSSNELSALDEETPAEKLVFNAESILHGHFEYATAPGLPITTFVQARIMSGEVRFVSDGTSQAPSYEIVVSDGSLESNASVALVNFNPKESDKGSGGIDLQKLYSSLSGLAGAFATIAGYLWWRSRIVEHRKDFAFAGYLRHTLNLEYHDFMRFQGDTYKTKIETFLIELNSHDRFYSKLTEAQQKSFAICVAEVLQQKGLISRSDCTTGLYGWFFVFSTGWSNKLDLKQFERESADIAEEAMNAWQAEVLREGGDPLTKWVYRESTFKEKVKGCCCARPSQAGFFARNTLRSDEDAILKEGKESSKQKKEDNVELLEIGGSQTLGN